MKWKKAIANLINQFVRKVFKKTVANIEKPHREVFEQVIEINKSAMSNYIEVLELIKTDVDAYFKHRGGVSARKTMQQLSDFTGTKLDTLKKLEKEYDKIGENDEEKAEIS